jgi:hypothetical protein
VEITYPRDSDYGSNPASLIWRRMFGVVALGFWAFVLIVALPWILSGSDRPLAVAARLVSLLAGFGLALLGGRTLVRAFLAAWKVKLAIYQRVSERDLVRASVTRRYRYVGRVQVLARHGSPGN